MWRTWAILFLLAMAIGCRGARLRQPSSAPLALAVHSITLPGAPAGGVFMDYLAYDRAHHRVWVPAGNTGSVVVIETTTKRTTRIDGFATTAVERHGTRRIVGPSSATVGGDVVYVGNRGDSSVCAVDAESLRVGPCVTLDSMPDALAYVASTKEVWVTMPRDRAIVVLDGGAAGRLTRKTTIDLDGQPEGFAVDDGHGVFYTNLEDTDRTLAIDTTRHKVQSVWQAGCGAGGPKGLTLDRTWNFLLVACTDRVMVLDVAHAGNRLSTLAMGDGIDNIDYLEQRHQLYAAAAGAARLTIARLDPQGGLTPVAVVGTAPGARNAVATEEGIAYLTDSAEGKILIVAPVASD